VTGRPSPAGRLAAAAAVLAAALAATGLALRVPPPRPADAPAGEFSARRAEVRLAAMLAAAGGPHPVASAANRRVRDFLQGELAALGLAPEVREAFACGRYRFCAPVANLVARVPGRGPGRPVLLVAHYDSVPAGPGAADDGSGVAILLESARALLADPPARDVVLLLDDGEEVGLAGAEAFLGDRLAREPGAVVNVEARGTGGPSLLFETTGPTGFVAGRIGAAAPGLLASSLFSTFYGLLPNDTDLTALRALSVPGANLAFIGGACRYHTPLDDLSHLDAGSLQHQGESALRLVRSFAAADLGRVPPGEAVFFDVLGLALVRFSTAWARVLAFAAVAASLLACRRVLRGGAATVGGMAAGAAALPLAVAAAAGGGYLAARALGLSAVQRPWVAHPLPLEAAFLACGLAAAALPAAVLGGRARAAGLRAGVALGLGAAASALAAALPGGSYAPLAPAVLAPLAVAASTRPALARAADAAVALAAGLALLPAAWLMYPAMGHAAGPLAAAAVAVAALPLSPLLAELSARARIAAAAAPGLAAVALALAARGAEPADAGCPERVVVYFHQDVDAGRARILASPDLGRLPPAVRAAAAFSAGATVPFGWGGLRPAYEAPARALDLAGPELSVEELSAAGGRLRLRGRLASRRGAPSVQVAVPPGVAVESFSFDGTPVPRAEARTARWFGRWSVFRRLGAPEAGVEVEMVLRVDGPVSIEVADESPGLPPEGAAVAEARRGSAVTAQEGDVTLFTRTIALAPH